MGRYRLYILRSSFQLAVLYFPLLALRDLIHAACPFADVFVQSTVSALLCFCVLFSDSAKTAWKKWALSLPFTVIFWGVLAVTDLDVRLINWMIPGYGRLSGGAGFAFIVDLGCFTMMQGVACLLAVGCSGTWNGNKLQKLRFVVQDIVLPAICVIVLFTVSYFELTLPAYRSDYYLMCTA